MNMSRLISLFFQGSLVKRIAAGLVLGILVALITPMLQPTLGFNLAEKVGVLGQIFVRSLRAVAPLLIFVLVMAAIANKKVGSKTSMKSIIVLYLVGTFLAALVAVIAGFLFPTTEVALSVKEDISAAPKGVGTVLLDLIFNMVDNPLNA